MKVENISENKVNEYNKNLYKYITQNYKLEEIKYLDLGTTTVRILNYSKEFSPLMDKQLTISLKQESKSFDTTIVLWKEPNMQNLHNIIMPDLNFKSNLRYRAEMLFYKKKYASLDIFDNEYSSLTSVISINAINDVVTFYDKNTNTYFYGVQNLEPEEFIKEGHIFVQILSRILKTKNTHLVHGACIGMNNNGILFCARGQRGKSTLTVLSLLKGFEYVSDDYLVLEKENGNLYAHPIYSIITLSPRMYNELYDKLDGTKFVSNNARKDKYVLNISNHHNQFKKKYPIKLCMFPEIVSDKAPSIKECTLREKGRAIVHLIHSTITQMQDSNDTKTVKKLIMMLKDFKFYKINLCANIHENVRCLRDFTKNIKE